jgi:hypothetical protein
MGDAFDEETQAKMVVIAAAAFAIDALYVKLDDMLAPGDRCVAGNRVGRIVETLKTSLDLGRRTDRWTHCGFTDTSSFVSCHTTDGVKVLKATALV